MKKIISSIRTLLVCKQRLRRRMIDCARRDESTRGFLSFALGIREEPAIQGAFAQLAPGSFRHFVKPSGTEIHLLVDRITNENICQQQI